MRSQTRTLHARSPARRRQADELRPAAREEQQAALLGILHGAGGSPVSYAYLQDHGIEFPASVASELELQGVDIERCQLANAPKDADGSHRLGLRMAAGQNLGGGVPAEPAAGRTSAPATPPPPVTALLGPRDLVPSRRVRWMVLLALLGAIGAAVAIVALGGASTAHPRAASGLQAPHRTLRASAGPSAPRQATRKGAPAAHQRVTAQPKTPPGPPTPVSATLAAQLEAEGHSLLDAGSPAAAVPVLTRAVAATGERLRDCLQPAGETCLTYAYALYDLGHAMQLSGNAGAAVPILRERLQIDNQRPVVQAELALAVAQAGHGG